MLIQQYANGPFGKQLWIEGMVINLWVIFKGKLLFIPHEIMSKHLFFFINFHYQPIQPWKWSIWEWSSIPIPMVMNLTLSLKLRTNSLPFPLWHQLLQHTKHVVSVKITTLQTYLPFSSSITFQNRLPTTFTLTMGKFVYIWTAKFVYI